MNIPSSTKIQITTQSIMLPSVPPSRVSTNQMLVASEAELSAPKENGVAQALRVQQEQVERRREDVEARIDSGSAAAGLVHDQWHVKLYYYANAVQKWRRGYTLMRSYENELGMKRSRGLRVQRGRTGRLRAMGRLQRAQMSSGVALVPVGTWSPADWGSGWVRRIDMAWLRGMVGRLRVEGI